MWIHLEIVVWGNSNLCHQDINSSVHTNQQLQLNPLENTIYDSGVSVWSRRNPKALSISSSPQKQQEYHEKFFGTFLSMKSQQMIISDKGKVNQCLSVIMEDQWQQSPRKTSKEWQCEPMSQNCSLSVGLSLYPFQISHILSSLCSSKTLYVPFLGSFHKNITCLFSAKYLLIFLLQQNILS
jgi:hypothetical protein